MKKFIALVASMLYLPTYMVYVTHNRIANGELINKLKGVDKVGEKISMRILDMYNQQGLYIVHKPNSLATALAVLSFLTIGYVFFALHKETQEKLDRMKKSQDDNHEELVENHIATQGLIIDSELEKMETSEVVYERSGLQEK